MSRIWKTPIQLPSWVTLEIKDSLIKVKWPKGDLVENLRDFVIVQIDENQVKVTIKDENDSFQRWVWWLSRTLIYNMIIWVTVWYEKSLEVQWVGYKFEVVSTNKLILSVGFSHKVELISPEWVTISTDPSIKNTIQIKWINKQKVGFFAAKVRSIKKPEPYKWKWIRFVWEYVRRKAGKTAGKK